MDFYVVAAGAIPVLLLAAAFDSRVFNLPGDPLDRPFLVLTMYVPLVLMGSGWVITLVAIDQQVAQRPGFDDWYFKTAAWLGIAAGLIVVMVPLVARMLGGTGLGVGLAIYALVVAAAVMFTVAQEQLPDDDLNPVLDSDTPQGRGA